jgi:uncharacterized protein
MRFSIPILVFFIAIGIQTNAQDLFGIKLSKAAKELTLQNVQYNATYYSIPYPMGDVPVNKGVCADVIIRAYRKLGIDLQVLVHEDMRQHFSTYPKNWGLKTTDKNIDHRRVPNLKHFFARYGTTLPITIKEQDYLPGDIVCWLINKKLPHIGIVINQQASNSKRNLVVHNVGSGQVTEDVLFSYTITGHYRYSVIGQ